MHEQTSSIFTQTPGRLSLVNDRGRAYLGLQRSTSPELNRRVRSLFEHLDSLIGFADTPQGHECREVFNAILRYTYPELLIDLADMIYVQHERPMVFLHFDHINANLLQDPENKLKPNDLGLLNERMEFLIRELAGTIRDHAALFEDKELARILGESYGHYLYETGNFPWEEPLDKAATSAHPVLDIATGLAGFSLIHEWTESLPLLVLTDKSPFIIEGLSCYKKLTGRKNVEVLERDFPAYGLDEKSAPADMRFGSIWANKFLHHLQREDRGRFLRWALDRLIPKGILSIVDTDLEYQILQQARDPKFREKLIPGYLNTLVEIEKDFCKNLAEDIIKTGFKLNGFDSHEYLDETDAFSQYPEDVLPLKFIGLEILAEKPA